MSFNELKSPKDRLATASEAAESMSFVRGIEKTGIPFDFWELNLACVATVEASILAKITKTKQNKKRLQNISEKRT